MAISPARSGQCRGADSRARRRTCNLYKPPLKWQTLPTCHCEERSDVAISPARSGQCRGAACRSRRRTCNLYKPPSKWKTLPTCHCEERSDVAISQYYVGYHESSGENVTAFPRLHPKGTSSRFALRAPRRFAPHNDNLGECRGAPAPLHGLIPLYKALTARKGHAASVRRQSRQRLRSERRYSQIWQRVRSAMACTGCNCLPEIATSLCSSQ